MHRSCCGYRVMPGTYCPGCNTFFEDILIEDAMMGAGGGIGIDPFDGQVAVDIPGTDLAVEPDGQIDIDLGGFDIPL